MVEMRKKNMGFLEAKSEAKDYANGVIVGGQFEDYQSALVDRLCVRTRYFVSKCKKADVEAISKEKDIDYTNLVLLWSVIQATKVINIDADKNGKFPILK